MLYFQNPQTGEIFAYETQEDRAQFGAENLVGPLTDSELAIARAPTVEQISAALKQSSKTALAASDITLLRCFENGVAMPPAWSVYRKALRAIVDGSDTTSTTLPDKPAYPPGT